MELLQLAVFLIIFETEKTSSSCSTYALVVMINCIFALSNVFSSFMHRLFVNIYYIVMKYCIDCNMLNSI